MFGLLVASSFAACDTKQSRQSAVSQSDSTAKRAVDNVRNDEANRELPDSLSGSSATEPVSVFKGLYTYGRKGSAFIPCDDFIKLYVVKDSTQKLPELYHKALKNDSYPGESIYAELKGYTKPAAGEKEPILVVTEVLKTEVKTSETDCYPYEFILRGTEPFWLVEIAPVEEKIIFRDVANERVHIFPYKAGRVGREGTYTYESADAAGQTIRLIIRKEVCSDGMSDLTYNYSAEVRLGRRVLKGCAVKKGDPVKGIPDRGRAGK